MTATCSQPRWSMSASMSSTIASENRSSSWGRGSEAPRDRGSNPDVTAERREPVEEPHQAGLVPHQIDGEERPMSDEHVHRAVTDDLVGDAPTGRLCEAGLRDLGHGHTSLPDPRSPPPGQPFAGPPSR